VRLEIALSAAQRPSVESILRLRGARVLSERRVGTERAILTVEKGGAPGPNTPDTNGCPNT
jgi:hypothetical protein